MSGRMVIQYFIEYRCNFSEELASGTYILTLKTIDGRSFTQKFIKK
ncbi:MAG: T9SS type A sorting domain-containing protein [Flavobacteriaceae bacterium]